MLQAYFNYPEPDIVVHGDETCLQIGKHKKGRQRTVCININSVSQELGRFAEGKHRFASRAGRNDMWLQIDFGDGDFEEAVLSYVHRLLGRYHSPFARITLKHHC